MEDVLSVYTRPRDPDRPLVCLDETSKQLVAETRLPIAMKPGQPARIDCEYTRNGVVNLFMMFAPLEGCAMSRSPTGVRPSTMPRFSKTWPMSASPKPRRSPSSRIISTHAAGSLYEAFPAAEARRLVERFEWRYTPKHAPGSTWLNPNSASSPRDASIDASPTNRRSLTRSPPGSPSETPITPPPIGASQPTTLASNSKAYTLRFE